MRKTPKTPKTRKQTKNHSHNDIPEKNHQITHKTSSKSKESVIVHQITHKTSIQSKESVIVHHITHKTTLRSKISVINHRITHKKTFPSNQTTIEITHRGIHESQPISDTRGLIPVSCHTHRPTTMSDMTTIFARPQKRKSKDFHSRGQIPKAQIKNPWPLNARKLVYYNIFIIWT